MTLSPTADPVEIDNPLGLELLAADPKSLVIGTNVRIDPVLHEDLISSIKARGVRTAISAYRDADGRVVVLRGQRRTLIAVKTGRPLVPVVIEPEPTEVERVVDQVGENDLRTGLSSSEHMSAYEQLSGFGLSADEIAAMTSTPKPRVEAGLRAASSPVARELVKSTPGIDLFQAAQLEEFADDPQIVEQLTGRIKQGLGFDHWVQHHRDKRELAAERAAAEQQARDAGFEVLQESPSYDDPKRKSLESLKAGRQNMTPELHAECSGRAATVYWVYQEVDDVRTRVWLRNEYCLDYAACGHKLRPGASAGKSTDQTPAQRAAATAERRRTIRFNALWRSAEKVRHAFLVELLQRKKAPKGFGVIMASAMTVDREKLSWSLQRGSRHAHTLLGLKKPGYHVSDELLKAADGAGEDRSQVIALCMVLAAYEDGVDEAAWKIKQGWATRYLLFLQSCGYELSEVEQIAAGLTTVADVEAALDAEAEDA